MMLQENKILAIIIQYASQRPMNQQREAGKSMERHIISCYKMYMWGRGRGQGAVNPHFLVT
jgi:hypothetical protein